VPSPVTNLQDIPEIPPVAAPVEIVEEVEVVVPPVAEPPAPKE
jgi:hypothetical protein